MFLSRRGIIFEVRLPFKGRKTKHFLFGHNIINNKMLFFLNKIISRVCRPDDIPKCRISVISLVSRKKNRSTLNKSTANELTP